MRRFIERLGARILTTSLQAACILLIARQVGPGRFGQFVLGAAVGVIVGAVVGLGSTTRVLRVLRESKPVTVASSLALLRTFSMVVSAAAVFVTLTLVGGDAVTAIAVAVIAAVDHFCDFEQSSRAGFLEHRSSTSVIVLQRGLPALAVTVSYVIKQDTIVAYACASAVVLAFVLRRPISRYDGSLDLREAVRGSVGYWFGAVAASLQQLDVIVVRFASGAFGVGVYGAANKLVAPLGILVNSAVIAFSPGLGQISDHKVRHLAFIRFARMAAVFGGLLALLSPAVAWVVGALLGPAYSSAKPIIIGVTVAASVGCVAQVLQSYLYMEGRARESAEAAFLSVILGLGALYICGEYIGTEWLWMGLFVHYVSLTLLLLWRIRHLERDLVS